jgi:hypothetical protein
MTLPPAMLDPIKEPARPGQSYSDVILTFATAHSNGRRGAMPQRRCAIELEPPPAA